MRMLKIKRFFAGLAVGSFYALMIMTPFLAVGCGPEETPVTPVDAPIVTGDPDATEDEESFTPIITCDGHEPVGYGQPGFNEDLDDDGDGVICEPVQ